MSEQAANTRNTDETGLDHRSGHLPGSAASQSGVVYPQHAMPRSPAR